ncbi:hypothetical protein D3C78_1523870 [compost metagenome]
MQVFLKEGSDGKEYLNEKIKLSGQVPDVMVPMIPELAPEYVYGVNFKGNQNPEVINQLRQSVINTMKLAQNFDGSDIAKALENRSSDQPKQEQKAPQQAQAPQKQPEPKEPESFDDFDSDLPF